MKMKQKTKKIIEICCFSLLIFSTITASVAWFVSNKSVTVTNDTEITCEGGNSLEIQMLKDNGKWTDWGKEIREPGPKASMEDITGSGLKLYKPHALVSNDAGVLKPTILREAKKATEKGGEYIELQIRIRSMSYIDIYLSGSSDVLPFDLNKKGQLGCLSSPDYIAGATRIAVIERFNDDPATDKLRMVWAPHPEYMYDAEKNEVIINNNSESFEKYGYLEPDSSGNPVPVVYNHRQYAEKQIVYGSTNSTTKMINNSPVLTTIDPSKASNGQFATSHLIFRIWFEGTDRESVLPLSGGHVKININLVGNNSKFNLDKDIRDKVKSIEVSNGNLIITDELKKDILVSKDGHNWESYRDAKQYGFDIYDELQSKPNGTERFLYFKYPEQYDTLEYITYIRIYKKFGGILVDTNAQLTNTDTNKERPKEVPINEKK